MVVVADALDVCLDLLALLKETLVLAIGRFERLLGLFQAHRVLWGPAWSALLGLLTRAWRVGLHPFELLLGFGDRLV